MQVKKPSKYAQYEYRHVSTLNVFDFVFDSDNYIFYHDFLLLFLQFYSTKLQGLYSASVILLPILRFKTVVLFILIINFCLSCSLYWTFLCFSSCRCYVFILTISQIIMQYLTWITKQNHRTILFYTLPICIFHHAFFQKSNRNNQSLQYFSFLIQSKTVSVLHRLIIKQHFL